MLSRNKRVAGDQLVLGRNPERDAALGVSRRVEDVEFGVPEGEPVALARLAVDLGARRGLYSQPGGLGVQMGIELGVVLIHVHRRAGQRLQLGRAADVVDVGVGDHDCFDRKPVPVEQRE